MKLCLEDPPPTLPNPKSNVLAEIDDSRLPDSLERLAYTQKQLWPHPKAAFEPASPPTPHCYRRLTELAWSGRNYGSLLTIKLDKQLPTQPASIGLGPNKVLAYPLTPKQSHP